MPENEKTSLLAARGLSAMLPGESSDVRVLDALSFALSHGEVVDVVGPSGSGKTTLLRAFARLLPFTEGRLELRGQASSEIAPQVWRSQVVLLPQKPAIMPGDIRSNLLLPWRMKERAEQPVPQDSQLLGQMGRLGLGDLGLSREGSRLSVGQQARVALARVLLTCPAVLLLDEPDAALDEASSEGLRAVVREFAEGGGGVVRVRHRQDDGLADRRLRLHSGRLEEVRR